MNVCRHKRVKKAIYKFRISKKSITYLEGKKIEQDKNLLSRIYVHLFETQIIKRIILKLKGKSYWN